MRAVDREGSREAWNVIGAGGKRARANAQPEAGQGGRTGAGDGMYARLRGIANP